MLVTHNLTPGESVYGEKRIQVQNSAPTASAEETNGDSAPATTVEYRVWNPFRSKLAAGIIGGLENIHMGPGSKVLYLGAASGTSVSHVADIVGKTGTVYAVEFSHRSGRDLGLSLFPSGTRTGANMVCSQHGNPPHKRHPHRRRRPPPKPLPYPRSHG